MDSAGMASASAALSVGAVDASPELAALRDSEARYRFLAENTSDIVVRASMDGVLLYVSPAVRALGYEPEALIGTSSRLLVHPDDLDQFLANMAALLDDGPIDATVSREHRYRTASGGWIWLEGNPRVIRDPSGAPIEIVNAFRNVTERRALREQAIRQARLAALGEEVAGVGYWRFEIASGEVTWSKQAYKIYGLELETTPSISLLVDLMPPEDRSIARLRFEAAIKQGKDWNRSVTRTVRPDGEMRYLEDHGVCERDAKGVTTALFGTVVDITERIRDEADKAESEKRYHRMSDRALLAIRAAQIGIWEHDLRSDVLLWDERMLQLYGLASDAVLTFDLFRGTVHPDDREQLAGEFHALLEHDVHLETEFRIIQPNGAVRVIRAMGKLERDADGAPLRIVGANWDVTDQVAQEQALAVARAEAEAAAQVKAEFLANMSHEIRTPLTAVIGFSSLLHQRPELDETSRRFVQRVSTAGRALLSIVNDILDFSKLEAGQFEIEPCPTSPIEVAQDALGLFAPQADEKGLRLECEVVGDLPAHLMMDPNRTRQILLNLIGNAVKFTDAGSVRLLLDFDRDVGALRIQVQDTGPGMSVEQQEKLFLRFSQVDASSTRKHGGTGLGLAICKGLAEAMGGQIGATSQVGEGSIFWFTLAAPVVDVPLDSRIGDQAPAGLSLDGVRVLVVDDNDVNRELARVVLESFGADVMDAPDGTSAIATAAFEPFDAILLDLRMPRLSGAETLKAIRAGQGPNQNVPILAFTADSDLSTLGEDHGFDGMVFKPIFALDLARTIMEHVSRARALST